MLESKTSQWNIWWVLKDNGRLLSKKEIGDCKKRRTLKIETKKLKGGKIINKIDLEGKLEKG